MNRWAPIRRGVTLAALTSLAMHAGGVHAAAKGEAKTPVPTTIKRIHYFAGDDGTEGFSPYGSLLLASDGNFYGTTFYGGPEDFRCNCSVGGTLYRMTPAGTLTVLHTFMTADGASPSGGLAIGPDGAFYGTTYGGGDYGGGTAFKTDTSGAFTMLHSFGGAAGDGRQPYLGTLALGRDGNFYGTTSTGGAHQQGVLYRMTPAGAVTVLHAFGGGNDDGATPRGGVTLGSDGNVYGTTLCGGANEAAGGCAGTVYRWSATAGFSVLHSFDAGAGARSGFGPQAALTERAGFLYGTTSLGGEAGAGTVFKLPLAGGVLTTLHSFGGGVGAPVPNLDGKDPVGRLLLARDGKLYGTTSNGGQYQTTHPEGDGTIFSIDASGAYALVFSFGQALSFGSHPLSALISGAGSDTALYGVTESGNLNYTGIVYSVVPPKSTTKTK